MDFSVDERLARAATLPAPLYTDPAVLAAEKARVFGASWQLVGRADQVARPGDFFTARVADEEVLVVRSEDEKLRALSNVCRHRAGPVASGAGSCRALRCGYHGWTYGLDGTLRACPEMEETEDFRKEDFGLTPVRVERWGPFVFANLDPDAPPLPQVLGAIPEEVARAGYDVERMRLVERREYLIECNWKVYVDNYLEGYHLPIAHPQLYRELDYDAYRVEEFRYYSKQHAPVRELKPGEELGRDRRFMRTADGEENALYYWVFPNTMFNIYPDNLSSNVILPLGHDRTLTIFEWFFAEPGTGVGWESMQQGIAFSDEIQQEDIVLCEQVQRGLRSRAYDTGRFSAKRENGVYHFQELVREFLGE